jgi:hypothetical protein
VGTPRQSPNGRVISDTPSQWLSPIRQIGAQRKNDFEENGYPDEIPQQNDVSTSLVCESGATSREGDRDTPLLSSPVEMDKDTNEDPDWIRETNETWLDQWQDCSANSTLQEFKHRLKAKRFSRQVSSHQHHINDSLEHLPPPEVRDTYQVTLKCGPHGLGLNLNLNSESLLVVTGFNLMPLGVQNPARSCRLISKGDLLMRVNDISLIGFDANETIDLLKTFLSTQVNVCAAHLFPPPGSLILPLTAICDTDLPIR